MSANFYETDRAVSEYLLLHYGSREQVLPHSFGPHDAWNFPARCVSQLLFERSWPAESRALDLGCAVGRSSFELARTFKQVIGMDASKRFITAAQRLQRDGELEFAIPVEGELTEHVKAVVPNEIDRSRLHFREGDAMNLPNLGAFEVVVLANLIDRLPDPRRCLERMRDFVKPGGQLIITSPCTWLDEFTPRKNWLGGFLRDGKAVRTLDTLKEILGSHFAFEGSKDMPFLIREHARKFQWSVAEASIWGRKS